MCSRGLVALCLIGGVLLGECYETAPLRPDARAFVPPPFTALDASASLVTCLGRRYDLAGVVPRPFVGDAPILLDAGLRLDGQALTPPAPTWICRSPGLVAAERSWRHGEWTVTLIQTVDYDGFITVDLTLTPAGPRSLASLTLDLTYRPEAAALYQVPSWGPTQAGFWPAAREFTARAPGVWAGNDRLGLAVYVASFRDWHGDKPWLQLARHGDGPGEMHLAVISQPTPLAAATTWRFGFIATPVIPPETKHWQLYAVTVGPSDVLHLAPRSLFWSGLSDHYATFSTNAVAGDADRRRQVDALHAADRKAFAYTTYAHVQEGFPEVPEAWCLLSADGKRVSQPVGERPGECRLYCCPGSPEWVEWKLADLTAALDRLDLDGFYVDTSYVITQCSNRAHGHGWVAADGTTHGDFLVWSMREVWRRAYELICARKGAAVIYAHHKSGCPPALAGFTSAFCDGEQYTGRSIRQLTLDAFRAQDAGRNIGPTAFLIDQYYRSARFGMREKGEHHNPSESAMLSLLHDVLPTGYPGYHPLRELLALRDDLGIAEAAWTPYYAAGNPWRVDGAADLVCSSYRTVRGNTLLLVGNPTYAALSGQVSGPAEAMDGRQEVLIDVVSRLGRGSPFTPGYRWEAAPRPLPVAARSFAIVGYIKDPGAMPAFQARRGFFVQEPVARRQPVPEGATLLDDGDDPDWVLVNDQGVIGYSDRDPVDTRRAVRIEPQPRHAAAAMLLEFPEPRNWSAATGVTFWVRPDRPYPLRAFDVRLRNGAQYTAAATLVSPAIEAVLPTGRWTQLTYEFRAIPRDNVRILRIYYHRGELASGPFDLDEVILHGGAPPVGAPAPAPAPAPAAAEGAVPD